MKELAEWFGLEVARIVVHEFLTPREVPATALSQMWRRFEQSWSSEPKPKEAAAHKVETVMWDVIPVSLCTCLLEESKAWPDLIE